MALVEPGWRFSGRSMLRPYRDLATARKVRGEHSLRILFGPAMARPSIGRVGGIGNGVNALRGAAALA
jgi:hypothetical protein